MPPYTKKDRVIADLEEKIRSHVYPVGTKLPSGSELCEIYDVSMQTVRDATNYLKAIGLVDGVSGSGIYVKSDGK
jgi:DNA-binding GntR family transcriptional regulator